MRGLLSSLFLFATCALAGSEPRWLRLCDKAVDAHPGTIAWEDAPLRRDLLDELKSRGWTLRREYRWENLVSAVPNPGATLPACVVDAGPVGRGGRKDPKPVAARSADVAGVDPATQALKKIWDAMGIESARQILQDQGKRFGKGVTVAVIDAPFAHEHEVLKGAQIGDSWDFVRDSPDPWDSLQLQNGRFKDIHGAAVAGLIASRWEGLPGIAPDARFLLYRAEDAQSETTVEEDNLAAAIVRAVDHGANIITTSLGYRFVDASNTQTLHPWSEYDGKSLIASRAATTAARHGVLVLVAAGNEGGMGGHSIGSPADADSVLVVGAIKESGEACWFSSWGPTADGRLKPDVSAFGCDVPIAGRDGIDNIELNGSGTSFATPLVAGLATLAWQLHRENLLGSAGPVDPSRIAMWLLDEIKRSGSLLTQDSVRGYGLPDLRRRFLRPEVKSSPLKWKQQEQVLVFSSSSAQSGGVLNLTLATLEGKVLLHRTGPYEYRSILWRPQGSAALRPLVLVARWSGDYGSGGQTILVLPR